MPESYTGDEGDEALSAGLDVMDGAEQWAGVNGGWRAINKTRDMVVWALNQAKAYADGLFSSISLSWSAISGKPSTFPPSSHTHSSLNQGAVSFGWNTGLNRWHTPENLGAATAIFGGDVHVGGHVYVANSIPATVSYTNAFINGDGRLSRGASSIRYKDLLDDPDPAALGDIWPTWREFTMKGGDGTAILGYIAEELAETPDQARFVVYATAPDGDGNIVTTDVPESIDFIQLLLAQCAQLNARVAELEARDEPA